MLRLASKATRQARVPLNRLPSYAMPPRNLSSSAPSKSSEIVPPGYSIDPNAGPMLRFEASLPRLPVPPLSSTTAKYLETVRPHLSDGEYSKTQSAVKAFLDSPLAHELQKRLESRAADPNVKNLARGLVERRCVHGIQGPRGRIRSATTYLHLDDKRVRDPAKRAAQLVKGYVALQGDDGKRLEPEKVKNAPLSMASYQWLFHACRYPTKPSDTAHKFDPLTHNHIVVIRKNKFFEVPLTHDGKELSAAELEVQFERIIQLAGSEKATPVGALTSDNRDLWADARNALLEASRDNAKLLERVESAMVIVCLDDTAPVTREDASWACWVGDGRNRFYDKHQLIVFENGKSGFLGEHSCMDGTPTLRMNEFMLASLAANKIDLGAPRTSSTASSVPPPRELSFVLDAKTKKHIEEAETRFDELAGQHDMEVLHYEGYGKEYIKKFKASPDAWAQLVKQLAFHKMFGRPGVCYESAQTRKYQLGRTEVIRSASNESKAWAEAMLNPDETDEHRSTLFRRAVARHLQYAAWAADGQGVDRHLFGLKKMLREGEPVPEIYTDPAFSKTNHWELSTSQLSSKFVDGWGYGEVVPDGYGLSYSIGDNYIRWTITSLKRRTAELKHYLAEAATETKEMMERAATAAGVSTADSKAKL